VIQKTVLHQKNAALPVASFLEHKPIPSANGSSQHNGAVKRMRWFFAHLVDLMELLPTWHSLFLHSKPSTQVTGYQQRLAVKQVAAD